MPPVPASFALALVFLSFYLSHPDKLSSSYGVHLP
jgi:hypothetical protein